MVAFSGFMIALSIFGMFLSLLWLVIALIRKRDLKLSLILLVSCFAAVFVFTFIGNAFTTDEDRAAMAARESSRAIEKEGSRKSNEQYESAEEQSKVDESEKQKELEESIRQSVVESMSAEKQESTFAKESTTTESINEEVIQTVTNNDSLSEEDYKLSCKEVWYDDIFFSKEDLEGKFVKIDVYFEEERFTKNPVYDSAVQQLKDKWNIYRSFYLCGVSRGEPNSYVGGQINMFFSENYGLSPDNYNTGQQAVVYGQIIDYSHNSWSGYNECSFIPKYIELK